MEGEAIKEEQEESCWVVYGPLAGMWFSGALMTAAATLLYLHLHPCTESLLFQVLECQISPGVTRSMACLA